jgi:hypothetical protein
MLLATVGAYGRGNEAPTLTIVLPSPYDEVLKATAEVAADGIVRGSAEYAKETSLAGAQAGDPGHLFGTWNGPGQALYKSRAGVLSPSHFVHSNDTGTVTVRYLLQAVDAGSTRITIDAVFVESSRHRRHPSDGSVEVTELGEIQQRLRMRQKQQLADKQRQEAEELASLQQTADKEKQELDQVLADIAALEQRAQALRLKLLARIKFVTQLQDAPFMHASSLRALPEGETVSVLISTAHWYYVRDTEGKEGWVWHSSLEKLP